MLKELIEKNRSYRRFDESVSVSEKDLLDLVGLARLSGSGSNKQPLKFILSWTKEMNEKIFPMLSWAGYLKTWNGPEEGKRPTAYVIILGDREISPNPGIDHGIAAQSILLGAVEKGFGGCMLGAVKRDKLKFELDIPDQYDVLLVIALGKPLEKVMIEPIGEDGDIKYYRDKDDVHHVPKRSVEELVLKF